MSNLYGPRGDIDTEKLSIKLKNWYFKHGWILSKDSAPFYFLVQEILNFIIIKNAKLERPDDIFLYSTKRSPIRILKVLRRVFFTYRQQRNLKRNEERCCNNNVTCDLKKILFLWKHKRNLDKYNRHTETHNRSDLQEAMVRWKASHDNQHRHSANVRDWVMLQLALSALRSQLVYDLGSRDAFDGQEFEKDQGAGVSAKTGSRARLHKGDKAGRSA